MGSGRYATGQNNARVSDLSASDASSSPRRRSVAIQDLLNPVGGDASSGARSASQSDHSAGSHHQGRTWSRQSSSDSSYHGSPRPRISTSSSSARPSPAGDRERRSFRPTYSEEEIDFIWYYRVDLRWEWEDIHSAFKYQFPDSREKGGIQCKYYRHLENYGFPKVRKRDRTAAVEHYGMRANTGRWYPWMER
ncbi:MAG: hypothetical protein LQ346_000535 [Caloplaca aetnensis]|nr:MAG: hypothetical protein LQ346_000535 [Caloplaca aetnensis]